MKTTNPVPTGKAYLTTAGVLIFGGIFYFLVLSVVKEFAQLILLGILGSLFTTVICSLFNLLYFLRNVRPFIRFILPGILFLLFVITLYSGAQPDLYIFFGFGLLNLIAGLYWFFKGKQAMVTN